ncbi:Rho termination factor N-terminal domain-containing protein, partial [Streptomyces sp. NPDC002454]
MSDTTDLMGVSADSTVDTAAAPATDASAAPATGASSGRRRRGTGLEGMVLAELQQVASGLGIRGTARMRKSQLIEVIKEAQAGGGAPAKSEDAPAETKPKRRATSKARTGEDAAEPRTEKAAARPATESAAPAEAVEAPAARKAVAQQQIEIPGQPASEDAPVAERRRRRVTAEATGTETVTAEVRTEAPADKGADAEGNAEGRGRRDRRGRERDRRGGKADDQGQQGGNQQRQ